MKRIQILVVAAMAALTMGAVAAGSASAATCKHGQVEYKDTDGQVICETEKEHAQWQVFANCPLFGEASACFWAESAYKEKWLSKKQKEEYEARYGATPGFLSEFTAGKVTVQLKLPILLLGGGDASEETGEVTWVEAANNAPTIEPVPQSTIPITKGVNKALLSPAEVSRYDYYVNEAKQTKTYATVELAGPASAVKISTENLIEEHGTAFSFPVKVKLSNPFLGEHCYVGSDSSPVVVNYTTGPAGELRGKAGDFSSEHEGDILVISGDTLVNSSFVSPGVEGCGVEGGADAAVDSALGLPAATGNSSVLNGVLRVASTEIVPEHLFAEPVS